MLVLGIETSCDETAAALVTDKGDIIADVVASQIATHAPYGGIVPELASRAHLRAIIPVIEQAVSKSPKGWDGVDGIAVTQGPGLVGSLLVGVQTAKALAWSLDKPLVGVNHLDGHLFAVYLADPKPPFPYIALLVSGGHTALYRVDDLDAITMLGQTRDDAAGEAFDKAAKLLGLSYPGGPVIDRLAAQGDPRGVELPIPMASLKNLDFSFSGLKTAISRHVKEHGVPSHEAGLADLCASFQRVVVQVLVKKSVAACEAEGIFHLVLTGGVAANRGLRARAQEACDSAGVSLYIPPVSSCTDNAAMIAYVGAQQLARGVQSDGDMTVFSRDPERRRGKFRKDGSLVER